MMKLNVNVKRQKSKFVKSIVFQLMHWLRLQKEQKKDRNNKIDEQTQTEGQQI